MRLSTWTNLITYILGSLLMMVGSRVALKSFYLQRESSTHLRVSHPDSKFLNYYITSYSTSSQQLFQRLQQSIFISSPIRSSESLRLDPPLNAFTQSCTPLTHLLQNTIRYAQTVIGKTLDHRQRTL